MHIIVTGDVIKFKDVNHNEQIQIDIYSSIGRYLAYQHLSIIVGLHMYVYTHTYIHTYIHTYAYMHAYTRIRTYVPTYIHTYICA